MQDDLGGQRFSVKNMDMSIDPKDDFYGFAAGGWIKTHTLPKDRSIFGAFYEIIEDNLVSLHDIAEECSSNVGAESGSYEKMVGDFYKSVMDMERIESLKFTPIEKIWNMVDDVSSPEDLSNIVPELHAHGVPVFFSADSDADEKNTEVYALYFQQGGLSLPDRDYYLKDSFSQIRKDFLAHMERMFILKGTEKDIAHEWAGNVLEIETEMAKGSRSMVELRDVKKNYNRMKTDDIINRYSAMDMKHYMERLEAPDVGYAIVGQPEYFDMLNRMFTERGADGLKPYLYWNVIHSYAALLHKEADSENFDMFGRKLTGQKEQSVRWKRAINVINWSIGEALGSMYVKRHFSPDARRRAQKLTEDLAEVFKERIESLDWMSDETRSRALKKLGNVRFMVGYPDKFRDYSEIVVDPEDYVGNVMRSMAFELRRRMRRIGKKVDKKEWEMVPQEVNAYFSIQTNRIVIPAGILQPPFFDMEMDDAVNYAGIGAIIGHEMTHGFDDQGRSYDENGNMNDWWTKDDENKFKERADRVVKEYSSKEVLPGHFINGEMTLGENLADLGGVNIAYDAMERRLDSEPGKRAEIDGFTPEQRFFIAYVQGYKVLITDEEAIRRLVMDVHSPDKYRGIIPSMSHPMFEKAFQEMVGHNAESEKRLGVW